MKLNENTISNILTIVIFVLVGALLINYFRSINKVSPDQTSSTSTEEIEKQVQAGQTVQQVVDSGLPGEYTVKQGDNLWKISEAAYGTGFDWVQVYEANKDIISNPDVLEVGTKITLPKIEVQPVEYTVARGDNLWNISVSICHNGYLWSKVASDNQIQNPNVIEPGQKLTIRCQ